MPTPKKKPFRTIKDSYKTGRFSREEVRRAIIEVMKERGELPAGYGEETADEAGGGQRTDHERPAA